MRNHFTPELSRLCRGKQAEPEGAQACLCVSAQNPRTISSPSPASPALKRSASMLLGQFLACPPLGQGSSDQPVAASKPALKVERNPWSLCTLWVSLVILFSAPAPLLAQFNPLPLNYAAYATGTGCAAINMSSSSYTDSFDSSQGSYNQTKQNTGGNVGVSGNINLSGSATINGTISALNIKVGACKNGTPGITLSGSAKATGGYLQLSAPPSFANPPPVTPGSKDYSFSKNSSLSPGSYHNITVSGGATLTFSPGTYNLNSISLSGGSILTFSGTGQVVVNVAGNKVSQPLNLSGGTMVNPSGVPANFQFIYGGTGKLTLSGGSSSYGVVYAPNAPVTLSGSSGWFGALVVSTLTDSGGAPIHYDRSLANTPTLLSLDPNSGQQGQQSLSIALTGQSTNWMQGTTTVDFGTDINVASLTVNSPTGATAVINIDSTAATGARTVTMTTGSEVEALSNGFTVNPGTPVLSSVNPNAGQQGQMSESVTVSGQFTHFAQGTTTASFGLGITVVSLTINSSTSATALLNIDPAASTGVRTVTLTTGSEVASLTNGFTVTAGTPVLLSVAPVSGQQGQQNLSVNLTGQFTNWVQGMTTASFGAGITVASLTVTSSTNATATLNIDAAAATGARTITLTTGSEVETLTNGFTVTAGTPVLLSVTPASGQQGQQNLSVSLTGQFTNWVQGTTTANFGAGITVASLTVNSSTSAVAVLNIDAGAATGARTVTLTTGGEVAMLANGFTVAAGTPVLLSVTPTSGQQGQQNLSVTLTGQFTNWVQGTTTASFGAGITVASLTVNSSTSAVAVLNIDAAAATGARTVTLTTGGEVATLANGFTVTAGTPVLLSVNPASGQQGRQNLSVSLTGQFTNWVQGTTSASFGDGITVASLSVNSPTSATAVLNIDAAAATGPRTVTLTTGSEIETLTNGFTVTGGTPVLLSVSPASGQQGQQNLPVGLTGQFTNWVQGTTTASFGAGITVAPLTVNSSTSATAVLNIDAAAATGARTVTLTTGSEIETLTNGFTVTGGTPVLLSVSPASGQQGQQNLSVSLTGQFTNWVQGTTTASFGDGITVASLAVNSSTSATAVLNIDAAAATGARTVTLTTGSEVATLANGFNVSTGSPALLSVNPNSGQQGQQSLSVTITGQFTHFLQGSSQVSFGAAITVVSLTVGSATSATAVLNIDPAAATGARTVTVTTGTEAVSLVNGFTVTASTPITLSVSPSSGQQGQQNLSIAITGQASHFVQGSTQASFGAGITVTTLTVNSPTSATAILNIDPAAATGARTVTVWTGSEVGTLTNGFTVTAGTPVLVSATPNSGQQGQQSLPVILSGQFTNWAQGTTSASFGAGITVVSLTVSSANNATAILNIDPGAATGARTVALTTGSEVDSLNGGFTVTASAPTVASVSPNSGQQGQQNLSVSIIGQNTHFVQGTSQVSFGDGITVASLTVNSATSAAAVLNIDYSAVAGARTVTLTTGAEVATLANGFTVTAPAPSLLSVSPNSGQQGQQNLSVAITGQNTHFLQGSSQATFGDGITVASLTVNSSTSATAVLNIDPGAAAGVRTVTVTTGSETESLSNGFTVTSPSIGIIVTPNAVAFGNVAMTQSSTQTVTISSSGTNPLTVTTISIAGSFFTLKNVPSLPLVLSPSATATFSVTFTPQATISSTATVTVVSNAPTSITLVQVSGTGTAPPQPPAAAITVVTDQPQYHRVQPVLISGAVTDASGGGISNVPVAVQITVNGLTRVLNPYTDAQGNYQTTFQPMPTDGGTFQVTATATSGGATQTASTSFRIFGLLLSLNSLNQDLVMGTSVSVPLNLQNIGDAALNNVTYSATITPTGTVTASFSQSLGTLAPGAPVTVPMDLTAIAGNPPATPVTVLINVTSTDSVSGSADPESSSLVVTLRPAVSTLSLTPTSLSVGVNPGGSLTRQFQVQNNGYLSSSNSIVSLQDPATFNWVTLGNSNLGNLAPGASQIFQVFINPPATLPLGNYTVLFNVSGGSSSLQGTLNISVTQSTLGAVGFIVSDDTGSKVGGATVTLYNTTTKKTFQGVTGSDGTDTISGVDAGDYNYVVAASSHDPASGTVTVTPSATAQVSVLLTYDVVSLTFTVTPTTITDQYTVVLNITYSTSLPKPALKVVPPNFNFSFFPADVPNGAFPCSLTITNTHQTAEVRNVTVDASQLEVGQPSGQQIHVQFADGTSVYQAGTLAAQASITVPCSATLDGNNVPTHAAGNIVVQGNYDFSLDGNLLQGTTTTDVPVSYTRPSDLSYVPIQFIYDETGPTNPVLEYENGSFVYTVTSERTEQLNLLSPSGAPFGGDNLVAFTATQGATSSLDVISANQSNAFWHTSFSSLKQSLLGTGDTTTYDISALDGGLTLTQALNAQIAANPAQALGLPMYLGFEGQWSDRDSPNGYLVPIEIIEVTPFGISEARPQKGSGNLECLNPEDPMCQDPDPDIVPPVATIDGQVQIQIVQKIRLERQAFNAMLGIGAQATLDDTVASVQILNMDGSDASSNFFVLVTGDPLGATHGGTVVGQTSVAWQLIPNAGAGGTSPQGTQYQVEATLSYVVNGTTKTMTTQAVTITVLPSPQLTVAYTAPFVVVDGKDAKIRVTVQNVGYGTANNLTIQSMQPTIAASIPADPSVPGLLVGFNITGSSNTVDSSGYMPGNLTIDFGDVPPGATVSGYWTLRVTQRGFFVSLSSTFTHDDYQGIQLDPLVLPPTTALVPAIGGTVTNSSGLPIPGLTVSLSQGGIVTGFDETDLTGEYYIQDLAAGSYLEQVTDSSGKVWASQNITVLGDQPTNFIDFVISNYVVSTLPATVVLDTASLSQTYDGTPKPVTATTVPAGLSVIFLYSGSFIPPVSAGSYSVVATIVDPTYVGTTSDTLTIAQATPIITWPPPAPIAFGTPLSDTQLDASVTMPGSANGPQSPASGGMSSSSVSSSSFGAAAAPVTRTASNRSAATSGGGRGAKTQDRSPTLPATLAFSSDRSGRMQIYTQSNPLPSPPTPVTTAGAGQQESREPDWSSGGRISYQFGAPGVRGIHRINADGSDTQLTPPPSSSANPSTYPCTDDRDPTWSPNGDFIAYACLAIPVGATVPAEAYQIWKHDNGGPPNNPLSESYVASVAGTQAYAPAWSPDGNSIAFVKAGPGAQAEIARLDMNSSFIYFLTQGGYTNFDPTWSPDSTQIAFSSTRAVPTDVLTSDGTIPSNGDTVYINGQVYTFLTALNGLPYKVLIGTDAPSTLANLKAAINGESGAGFTYGAGTSPNSAVFASFVTSNALVVQAFQSGSPSEIATTSSSPHLTWANAFLTAAPGGHHIFVMSVLCPEAQSGCRPASELTAGPGDDTKPAWSPEGSEIAFVSNRTTAQNSSGRTQIYLISPSQPETPVSPATVISDGTANDADPAWNPEFVATRNQLNVEVAPVTVTAGLPTPSQVTVTVTDPSGNPVNGATVTVVPPQTGFEGTTPIALEFSSLSGPTVNGQFTFTALEPNDLQESYQFQFAVSASGIVNGNPASGSTDGTINIVGLGSILPPQPPPGVSNQERLPVGAIAFTPQIKAAYIQQAKDLGDNALWWAIGGGLTYGLIDPVTGAASDKVLQYIVYQYLYNYLPADGILSLVQVSIFLGPASAVVLSFEIAKVASGIAIANLFLYAAEDPPDPNFTVVALPVVQAPPAIALNGGPLSQDTLKLMNQSLAVKAVIQAYLQALQTSANRYSTALSAGDLTSAALQRDAILNYDDTLVSLFNSDAAVTQNLLASFQQDGLPNLQLTPQNIATIQYAVATYGLPGDVVQDLQQLGASVTNIAEIQNSLVAANPTSLPTDFFSSLQSEAQYSLNASAAFIVGARSPGPVNTVGGDLVYTPPAGTVLNAGTQTLSVVFTPTDTTDYTTASASVPLQVSGSLAIVTLDPASLTQDYDGTAKSVTVTTSPANLSVSVTYTQNGITVPAPTNVGTYSVTATIIDPNYQGVATGTLTIEASGTKLCIAAPSGLVSWWAGDANTSDLLGTNNPSASSAATFVSAEVGNGFTFGSGGYIDTPASPTLANQQFTWSAWARPDGPGPNNDSIGSVIVGQDIDSTDASAQLTWRATDNRFLFIFGDQSSELIASTDSFAPGQFYLVTATYDGSIFSLYVNGNLEGQFAAAKSIGYSSLTWTIGSTDSTVRGTLPRTWNGVIDEVQAYNRALSQSDIQEIYGAANLGACKGQPAISLVTPNGGQQGQQSLSVAVTGQFTNWAQGTTSANFGAGITVASLTVNAATSATATVNIDPAAATGAQAVTLTTGSEVDTLASGFTVTAGTPVLLSVTPASGQQGQQVTVSITGQFTHFLQGATVATFGQGITVTSLTVNSSTSATAVISIDAAAPTGASAVQVTTGSEAVTLNNGFTVIAGTPMLLSVTPSTGQQGQQSLSVSVTGLYTNFVQGITTASFGTGITVASLTVASPTGATAVLNISASASTGARTVTMTTGSEVATLANSFTVTGGAPALVSVSPTSGVQGQQNLSVALTGQFTNWVQGTTTASFGGGITVASLTVNSATSATALLNISATGATGARTVTLTTGGEVDTLTNGFTVTAGTPVLLSATPNSGQQGQQNLSVSLTGQFTNWVQGTTTANFGAGITVVSLTVNSSTVATAVLNIDSSAAPGTRTVTLTTGTEIDTLTNGFTVTGGASSLVSVSPNSGKQGQQNLSVALTGLATNWVQGTTTADFGAGITVVSLSVSSSSAVAVLNISSSAASGARTVTMTTGSEVETLTNGFTVTAGTPVLLSVSPATGQQGQQNLSVALTGQFTNWAQGTTTANFGAGITVASLTVSSSTTATAIVNIDSGAATGVRTVTMTTGSEVDTLIDGFSVASGTSALLSVNPASGQQGQQNLSVALTGQFTNWVQGTTTASFGAGITVVSLTVNSSTSATAVLNIDPAAATGARTVTMTTGSEVETLTSGFIVSANACVAPPSGMVSWWPGDGNANDIIGSSAGTLQNGTFGSGLVGQAFSLNEPGPISPYNCPTCGYVSIANHLPSSATAITVDAWVYPDQSQQAQGSIEWVYTQYSSGPQLGFVGTDTILWRPNGDGEPNFGSPGIIPSNTWTFLAATYDSTTGLAQLYVNGNLVWSETLSGSVPLTSTPYIGKRLNQEFFVGLIDEVEVYTRALSASEIQGIYNAGGAGKCKGQPTISSLTPNSGQQGQQNLSVALTGYFTNWVQGTTTASFGDGITVASLTVNSPTSAVAVLNIDAAAAPGARTVTLTTGSEVATLTNGFTVTAGTPALLSVNPNSGVQGEQNLSVALTGQSTNWVQGTTTANFGAGITVSSLTVNSATTATAVLDIDPTAATGVRTVTMTTGSEVETLANGFTVTATTSVPDLTVTKSHSGNFVQGQMGATYAITINNIGGVPTAGPVTVIDTLPAGLTATGISGGGWSCALGTLTCTRSDTLAAGASYAPIAATVNVADDAGTIPITNAGFEADVLNCQAGPNCYDLGNLPGWSGGTTFKPSTGPGGEFPSGIPEGVNVAAVGCCQPNPDAIQDLGFAPAPNTTYTLTVSVGQRADSPLTGYVVELLVGSESVAAATSPIPAPGSFVTSTVTYTSGSSTGTDHLMVHLGYIPGEQVDFDNVKLVAASVTNTATVSGGGEVNTANDTANDVTVIGPATCADPPSGLVSWWAGDGNTSDLLAANNASTSNAVTYVPGEVANGFTFGSGGYIDIPASTSLANQQFTWSVWARPDGSGPNEDSFGSVIVGQNVDDTHTSAQINWRASDNRFLFIFGDISSELIVSTDSYVPGQFYLVTATYDGSTFKLYVNGNFEGQFAESKTIPYSSQTWSIGSTNAELRGEGYARTWNGVIDEVQAFNRALSQSEIQEIYTAASAGDCKGQPILSSVAPNSGQQGQQNLSVALTGYFTNWVQGTTTASFGAGITVASLTVNSPTSATAVINIDPAAVTGARTVTLTTGSEVATLTNGYTVTAGTPALLSVNPNSGVQGEQNLSVALTGQFTNWVQGTTTASFGDGVTVVSLTVNSSTSATALINIDSAATVGTRTVTLTTGSEIETLTNGFTVTDFATTPPQIVQTSPADGASNVSTSANVVVTFNKPVDPSTVTAASFSVLDVTTGLAVSGQIQVDASDITATFTPSQSFASSHLFSTTLTTAIKDFEQNNLAANFTFAFTTGSLLGIGEADSMVFSVLNTAAPPGSGAGNLEADSVMFSVLNTAAPPGSGAGNLEADSVVFSVLNTAAPPGSGAGNLEADSVVFSVLNNAGGAPTKEKGKVTPPPVDTDGDGYPDDLETALGSDPNDPASIPEHPQPPPFVESPTFSLTNEGQPEQQSKLENKSARPSSTERSSVLAPAGRAQPKTFQGGESIPARTLQFQSPGEVVAARDLTKFQNSEAKGESHVVNATSSRKPSLVQRLFGIHRRMGAAGAFR
jgi:Concanavalin A-like lectin/glucanases superfamily/HpiC1 cyclase/MBG domain/Bacterial Ig-like domain/Cep192 domain 4/WD40-like Beta Propeller Repeat